MYSYLNAPTISRYYALTKNYLCFEIFDDIKIRMKHGLLMNLKFWTFVKSVNYTLYLFAQISLNLKLKVRVTINNNQ